MKSRLILLSGILGLILFSCTQSKEEFVEMKSPDRLITVTLGFQNNQLGYTVNYKNDTVLLFSKLGLILDKIDFSNLKLVSVSPEERVKDNYELLSGKKLKCDYEANRYVCKFINQTADSLEVIFQISDDGIAFRYHILQQDDPGQELIVQKELTSFNFPKSATAWLHPREKAGTGWCRTQPSYEENYQQDVSVGEKSVYGEGWTFPALFKNGNVWTLLTETDMGSDYCASHLAEEVSQGEYFVNFPDSIENLPEGNVLPHITAELNTPWRVLIIGSDLSKIVESTLCTDISTPSVPKDYTFVKPGIASWSWAMLNDTATIYPVQKEFIDYASEMKWPYCLIDGLWDKQIGYDKIKELADYAKSKGVGLWLWYNSAGTWNDTPQTPRGKMLTSESRKAEFQLLKDMGIKGIKVDFFAGDGQSMMKYYQDILMDAADYGLMINFHGATIPRGWTRTYPNLMTAEAVKGFEYITFNQENANVAAVHCCMLPFTRNVVAPMDFTPLCFSEIYNIKRLTSNAFELALSVIFESGIQHFVETPKGMKNVPEYVLSFLSTVPTAWDDIKYLDGYPGEYVVLARKKNNRWYIGGINAKKEPVTLKLDLGFIGQKDFSIITDGNTSREFNELAVQLPEDNCLEITMKPCGGFVLNAGK